MSLTVWHSKDGRATAIKDLKYDHIKNILNYMDRFPGWREEYRAPLEEELKRKTKRSSSKNITPRDIVWIERG